MGEIREIPTQLIEPVPLMLANSKSLTESLVKPQAADREGRMLVILSAERVIQRVIDAGRGQTLMRLDYCAA